MGGGATAMAEFLPGPGLAPPGDWLLSRSFQINCAHVWEPNGTHDTKAGLPWKKVAHWGRGGLDGAQEGGGPLGFSQLLLISQQLTEVCAQMGGVGLLCEIVS